MKKKNRTGMGMYFRMMGGVILVIAGSYYVMTWLFREVIAISSLYLSTTFEMLGTSLLAAICMIIFIAFFYRRRSREIRTLSDAITQVAAGNYHSRITYKKRDPMGPVYERFNKMCDELSSVQTLRHDFASLYSHEFRTPVGSINGFASLLLEGNCSAEDARLYLEIIRDESERLSKMGENTILFTHLTSQKIISDKEDYRLDEQIRQCLILLSGKWEAKKIAVNAELQELVYFGNKEIMQHLWLNLIENAIKHTGEKGRISLVLEADEENIIFAITDNGEGMDEETQKHLFEPYFQGESREKSRGLGLGLAIAGRIAEMCGGHIEVKSQPGEGSVFVVMLSAETSHHV